MLVKGAATTYHLRNDRYCRSKRIEVDLVNRNPVKVHLTLCENAPKES